MVRIKEVHAFVSVAKRYCELVETAHLIPLEKRLMAFALAIADLYLHAAALPKTEPRTDRLLPVGRTSLDDWPGFGTYEGYSEVFDPYAHEDPVFTVLTDDILDIYWDLKPGLTVFDRPDLVADVIWDWRFSFVTHWGDHAVDALRALHRAMVQETGTAIIGPVSSPIGAKED